MRARRFQPWQSDAAAWIVQAQFLEPCLEAFEIRLNGRPEGSGPLQQQAHPVVVQFVNAELKLPLKISSGC